MHMQVYAPWDDPGHKNAPLAKRVQMGLGGYETILSTSTSGVTYKPMCSQAHPGCAHSPCPCKCWIDSMQLRIDIEIVTR